VALYSAVTGGYVTSNIISQNQYKSTWYYERMRTIKREIVGGILLSNDGHVLIEKNVKGGVYEDLWVIPGGGIDEGETAVDALKREIQEEVGIDIGSAKIIPLPGTRSGTAEKTLRDTGERILVDMMFHDFQVLIDLPFSKISVTLDDDFGYAEWVPLADLSSRVYSPALTTAFKMINYL
jgi:8-oxo-dGTP pyrophosphatase MutT (NUDIX family)